MLHQSKDREKMCNCMVLDVTAIFFWITAFLKKLPFLAKGLVQLESSSFLKLLRLRGSTMVSVLAAATMWGQNCTRWLIHD